MKRFTSFIRNHGIGIGLFSIPVLLAFYFLGWYETLFLPPHGIHFIRQTDSLAFILNYANQPISFWEPEVFNLFSNGGKAACEFPIIYYLFSFLTNPDKPNYLFIRAIYLGIVLTGFYAFFYISRLILQNNLIALLYVSFFIFSGVIGFYAPNFLPDAPALGFTLVGFSLMQMSLLKKNTGWIYFAFIFFILACLIKITYFIYPIAYLFFLIFRSKTTLFEWLKNNRIFFILFLLNCLLLVFWTLYFKYYNQINGDYYFLSNMRPIWSIDAERRAKVWELISNYWYDSYLFPPVHIFLAVSFVFIFSPAKVWLNAERISLSVILLVGMLSYFILFYNQFHDHDYYFLTLIPGLMWLGLTVLESVWLFFNNQIKIRAFLFYFIFLIGLFFAVKKGKYEVHAKSKVLEQSYEKIGVPAEKIKPILDSVAVNKADAILVMNDHTRNGSLIFLNRKGIPLCEKNDFFDDQLKYALENKIKWLIHYPGGGYNPDSTYIPYPCVKITEIDRCRLYKIIYP